MKTVLPLFENEQAREIAKRHCRTIGVSIRVLDSLVESEMEQIGKKRKRGLWESFDEILGEDEA